MTSNNETNPPVNLTDPSSSEPIRNYSPDIELGPIINPVTRKFREIMDRFIELCRGDLDTLLIFIKDNACFIQVNADDYAAWRVAVVCLNEPVLKYLRKTYLHELLEQPARSLTRACLSGDLKVTKMMLDPEFGLSNNHVLFALQTAGETGNKELIDLILTEKLAGFNGKYIPIIAAICGVLRSGKPQLLAHFMHQVANGCDQATTEKLYRGILVRAAQIGDPETFIEVLKRSVCGFKHEPNSDHSYFGFNPIISHTNHSNALLTIFNLCCKNPSSLLIDAVIDAFGRPMLVDSMYHPCLNDACANGHTNAVKFLTDKHTFSFPALLVKVARAHNRASVIALFFYKFGEKVVFGAEPEHTDHIRQLLSQHFAELASQFASGSGSSSTPQG